MAQQTQPKDPELITTPPSISIYERLDRLEARLDRHARYLNCFDKIVMKPAISIGVARLRYDLIRRIHGELDSAGRLGSKTHDETDGLNGYAISLTKAMLQEAGLEQLVGCLGLLTEEMIGVDDHVRVKGDEGAVASFAYAVVEGQKLGDPRCARIRRELGDAFHYTYGRTWEEVATEAEDRELPGPDTLPEDATTQDIVETLIANVREFANRLRLQIQDIQEKNDTITELEGQLDKLLGDQVARKAKYESLGKRFTELKDLIENIRRLKASLENYRSEEERLNALVNKMELEYNETVMKMNIEREQTVQELSERQYGSPTYQWLYTAKGFEHLT
ncbi:hypothetical protein LTR27_011794 [Elasticomyces elasticus]|nr:hypothetical protein LTR27_011794 [Elasticomyces elasticus]